MWWGRRKGDGSIGKVIGDKEGGIVGMLADSLVPIHPVFSIRPSFSCPTKFTTRFSFLTIAPLPFFCGILGKISMHDGPSIAASFLPPRHYRGGTNVPGSESFARDSSRRQVFTLFRWFSFHVYRRCREFFFVSLVLFTILLWDSSLFFLWFNFFKWYTREEDSSREEVTNEISYFLEMKRIWSSLEVDRLTKKTWELYFFRIFWTLILFFFWNLKITLKGKFASEIYFIFRKWNVFWWKGLIFVKFTTFCPLPCNLIKMIIFVKWMEKFEYIRLYKFFYIVRIV